MARGRVALTTATAIPGACLKWCPGMRTLQLRLTKSCDGVSYRTRIPESTGFPLTHILKWLVETLLPELMAVIEVVDRNACLMKAEVISRVQLPNTSGCGIPPTC